MKTIPASFDELIVTPEFVADPYPVLHRLREEEPVYWSDAIGGWILTGYNDILVSFKDTAHFSNENRLGKAVAYLTAEKRANYKPFEEHYATKSLLHSDPPDHTRMRAIVTKEFTAKVVEQSMASATRISSAAPRHGVDPPQGLLGQAIDYTLKRWSALMQFVEDGTLEIDNNLIENAIRPSALGKKNFLFFGHPEAGERSAVIYTLLGSCRCMASTHLIT